MKSMAFGIGANRNGMCEYYYAIYDALNPLIQN